MKTATGIMKTAIVLLIFISLIYLYTLLHEGGHALVAIMHGGRIDNFVLGFNAHVTHSGANFTRVGESLHNSAGTLLPAAIFAVALIFYNRNVNSFIYHCIYGGFSIMIPGSLLAWVAIPLMSLFTAPPAGDDVSRFLDVSGINPLLVSLIALLLIFLFVFVSYKKGLYAKIMEYLKTLSQAERTRPNKRQAAFMVLSILFCVSVAFFIFHVLSPGKVFEIIFR